MIEPRQKRGAESDLRARRGVALVIVIALLAICLILFGVWARRIVDEQRRIISQQFRLQATRLAEAGVQRAKSRHAVDPDFREETWRVPAASLGGVHDGQVRMRVLPADQSATVRCEAVANFPADSVRHAQVTKRIEIDGS